MRALRSTFLGSPPLVAGLTALIIALAAPAASAITVSYTTTGAFSGLSPNLDFLPGAGVVSEPTSASFGTFQSYLGLAEDYTGDTFTLTITQLVPGPGGPTSVSGDLTGVLTTSSSGLTLTFLPSAVVTIVSGGYSVVYNPVNETLISPSTSGDPPVLGQTTLQGTITATPISAVPLPHAVWGGMGLLGLLGAGKFRRLRQLAV